MAKNVLTPKQLIFVQEYLVDKNATRAAKAAGYSSKTAHSSGPRMLENVGVAKAIEKGLKAQADKAELSGDRVIKELAEIAFSRVSRGKTYSGKLRALELLGKHFGLFSDKVEISGANSGPQVIFHTIANGSEADLGEDESRGLAS